MKALIWCGCVTIGYSLAFYGSISFSKMIGLTVVLMCGVALGAAITNNRDDYRRFR